MAKKNYKIDFTTMTLIMTKEFEDNLYNPKSEEYKIYQRLQKDFPSLSVRNRTHRSPKKARADKGLTYKNMMDYIKTFDNAEELLKLFDKVREKSKVQTSKYDYVKKWFMAQFPNYGEIPTLYELETSITPFLPKEVKEDEASDVA